MLAVWTCGMSEGRRRRMSMVEVGGGGGLVGVVGVVGGGGKGGG